MRTKTTNETKTITVEEEVINPTPTEETATVTIDTENGPIEMEVPVSMLEGDEPQPTSSFYLGEFDRHTLESFLDFSKTPGPKDVYIISAGGSYAVCCVLIDIINKNPEDYTLKVAEMALSAGFYIMLHTTCKIEEIGTQYHLPVQVMQHGMSYAGKLSKKDRAQMERGNDKLFGMVEKVLTPEQITKRQSYVKWTRVFSFMKRWMDDDIYLSISQLKELFGERLTVHE